ncbi:MAG: hypothetical protein P1V34_02050 [Alphaproteobacteria bacterium]|nr:hypothetical protein [Alphaproteobacteria bacterium]
MRPYPFPLLCLITWLIGSASAVAQSVDERETLCRATDTAAEQRLSACGSLIEGAAYTTAELR